MRTEGKKLLFLLIDAFGISPTWKGNAILSANPQGIFNLWSESRHFLIDNDFYKDEYYSQQLIHSVIATGRSQLSDKKYIDQVIADKSIFSSLGLSEIYDQAARRSSAIHLVGFLPKGKEGKYSDADQIISFINHARSQSVHNIYLHLFLDETLTSHEVMAAVNSLERKLAEIGAGEIVTIAGAKCLENQNLKNLLKCLVIGYGKKAFSAGQAVTKYVNDNPTACPPVVIMSKDRPTGRLKDFDIVFYCNFTSSELERLITSYLSLDFLKDLFNTIKLPRFLSFISLFRQPELEEKVKYLTSRNYGETIVDIISEKGLSQVEVADASRVNYFLTNFNNSNTPKGLEKLFLPDEGLFETAGNAVRATLSLLQQGQFDVIYAEISLLQHLVLLRQFRDAISGVSKLDSYIGQLKAMAEKNNYHFVISSNNGGVEKMADLSDIEKLNQKSLSPIPLILANEKQADKKAANKNIHDQFMYDMMSKRNNLIDIAPTLLGLLGMQPSKAMQGHNLLLNTDAAKISPQLSGASKQQNKLNHISEG